MAFQENWKGAFDDTASVRITFSNRVIHIVLWVEGDDAYIEFDGVATNASFKIPRDTVIPLSITCNTLDIIGVTALGSGTYEVMDTYYTEVTTDFENQDFIAGIDV